MEKQEHSRKCSSFVPDGKMMALRHLILERLDFKEMGSTHLNKLEKHLALRRFKNNYSLLINN